MSRKPRFQLVGVPQHVIQRGNNRGPCFHGAKVETRVRTQDSLIFVESGF